MTKVRTRQKRQCYTWICGAMMSNTTFANLKHDPIQYLMSSRQPAWVKYQTLVRLLRRPLDDQDVVQWRKERDASAVVHRVRSLRAPDGSFPCMPWMHVHKYYFHQMLEMGFGLRTKRCGELRITF